MAPLQSLLITEKEERKRSSKKNCYCFNPSQYSVLTPHPLSLSFRDVARIFTLGPQKLSAEGTEGWEMGRVCPIPNQVGGLMERHELPQRRQRIVGIFEAHRTHLVERTVLLYWIKQALRPNKASFFPLKNQSTIWGTAPLPPPSGYAPAFVHGRSQWCMLTDASHITE